MAGLGLWWEENRLPCSQRGAALGGSAASMRQAVWVPGVGSPSRSRRNPGRLALALARRARPALEGLNFGPRSADTRGSVNAMTSLLFAAAQQEMLSASPLPARRKWGSLLQAVATAPAQVWFRGRRAGRPSRLHASGRRGPGAGGRDAVEDALTLQWLTWPSLPGDVTVLIRSGCHWPWGDRIPCIIERTPGQVGQKHWRAPETGE